MYREFNSEISKLSEVNSEETIELLLVEEMAELTQALVKFRRFKQAEPTLQTLSKSEWEYRLDIASEMADVIVMMHQWMLTQGTEHFVAVEIRNKIKRTLDRMVEIDD